MKWMMGHEICMNEDLYLEVIHYRHSRRSFTSVILPYP